MTHSKKYDVAIVGAGITGLSTAWHLRSLGIKNVVMLTDSETAPASINNPGMVYEGLQDNFTRLSHAYGDRLAREIWGFAKNSVNQLEKFVSENSIGVTRVPNFRLMVSSQELKEGELAAKQLQEAGYSADIVAPASVVSTQISDSVLGVQTGEEGLILSAKQLITSFQSLFPQGLVRNFVANEIKTYSDRIEVHARDEQKISAEMVVMAAHNRIPEFFPEMGSILIPYADQWTAWSGSPQNAPEVPFMYSAHFGLEWGVLSGGNVSLGGARFLRKMAGIGAGSSEYSEKARNYVLGKFKSYFPQYVTGQLKTQCGMIGLRPCDELPLIGPMFGESRIFIGTGYMGNGLGMGFAAGKAIAELIYTGRCSWLPYFIQPQRLRSLEM